MDCIHACFQSQAVKWNQIIIVGPELSAEEIEKPASYFEAGF
jgi:hypothetical protein